MTTTLGGSWRGRCAASSSSEPRAAVPSTSVATGPGTRTPPEMPLVLPAPGIGPSPAHQRSDRRLLSARRRLLPTGGTRAVDGRCAGALGSALCRGRARRASSPAACGCRGLGGGARQRHGGAQLRARRHEDDPLHEPPGVGGHSGRHWRWRPSAAAPAGISSQRSLPGYEAMTAHRHGGQCQPRHRVRLPSDRPVRRVRRGGGGSQAQGARQ